MRSSAPLLRRLLAAAPTTDQLWLPRLEPHPGALVIGLGGVVLGVLNGREGGTPLLGWLALSLCLLGALLYSVWQRDHAGWRLHLPAPARAEPVNADDQARELGGPGWAVYCVGGSGRRTLALEFRHVDGGKPLRVFQTRTNANRTEHQLTSQLADALAARLHMGREGLTL